MIRTDRSAPAVGTRTEPRSRVIAVMAAVVVSGAGLLAYWGTWRGEFIFDDNVAIVDNLQLQAGDWWGAAFARPNPLANRPLASLSLVLDAALFGPGPFGPHLANLLLHLANGLLLLLLTHRALRSPNLAGRFVEPRAWWLATAIATLWCVHPLGVDAVAYATQRSTLLANGCLLLSLHATLRAHAAQRRGSWRALAVVAMACGMASKEDLVVGPLLLVLFERAFLLPSWAALRARTGYHVAVASTWLVLATCLLLGPHNPTVGYSTGRPVTAWQWLTTQAGVVAHYLRLTVWPHPLRGAYDWPIAKDFGTVWVPGAVVVSVLAYAVACWRRRPWFGWLGALFFLLLAPTSTVMPIVTEVAAEKRVYLPMLFVLVPIVVGAEHLVAITQQRLVRWLGIVALAAAAIALCTTTRARVDVYADSRTFWHDAHAKRDAAARTQLSSLILTNYGDALFRDGRHEEAFACYELATRCDGASANTWARHGLALMMQQRFAEATTLLTSVAESDPTENVLGTLGVALAATHEAEHGAADDPRLARAEAALRQGLTGYPGNGQFWNALAYVLRTRGRLDAALEAYQHVARLNPEEVRPWLMRAEVLAQLGRAAEIGTMFDPLLARRPRDVALRMSVARTVLRAGDAARAMTILREVLAIEPGHEQAAALLRELQAGQGR